MPSKATIESNDTLAELKFRPEGQNCLINAAYTKILPIKYVHCTKLVVIYYIHYYVNL